MLAEAFTTARIRRAARALRLSGWPHCVHASLRSFGWVDGGARTVCRECDDAILGGPILAARAPPSPPEQMRRAGAYPS